MKELTGQFEKRSLKQLAEQAATDLSDIHLAEKWVQQTLAHTKGHYGITNFGPDTVEVERLIKEKMPVLLAQDEHLAHNLEERLSDGRLDEHYRSNLFAGGLPDCEYIADQLLSSSGHNQVKDSICPVLQALSEITISLASTGSMDDAPLRHFRDQPGLS